MNDTTIKIPETIALTYDTDHSEPPNWQMIEEQAVSRNPDKATAEVTEIVGRTRELWDHPDRQVHTTMVTARNGHVLSVGGGDDFDATQDRATVQKFKLLNVHEQAGFDGTLAAGTRDSQFAWWLTPTVIWEAIAEGDYQFDDFDQEAIEDAIRSLTSNNDWAYGEFCGMRKAIIEDAAERTLIKRGKATSPTT